MVLSGRQREELNKAIAEYLGANGYLNTLNEFQKEADLNSDQDVDKKFVGKIGGEFGAVLWGWKKVENLRFISTFSFMSVRVCTNQPRRYRR